MRVRLNGKIILEYLEEQKISRSKFCRDNKIAYSTLMKIINGTGNFRITVLFKIARVIKRPLVDFFK